MRKKKEERRRGIEKVKRSRASCRLESAWRRSPEGRWRNIFIFCPSLALACESFGYGRDQDDPRGSSTVGNAHGRAPKEFSDEFVNLWLVEEAMARKISPPGHLAVAASAIGASSLVFDTLIRSRYAPSSLSTWTTGYHDTQYR
ncbi:hypothetical protein BJ508DRAFT_16890 [Ascobolus immersus RN42]|uniref:Uncharacterized protein n=1 Tax=Ascobolus immersus RN42 TaxID=1160509 RepID=A0A3N4HPG8_ASCIM|nr:hypothetical protein BJ508DRAFT_16890 [Ascobolus immersus RN42]